ncbi:MAG: nascent polypeptide-associated complex protein [archaeon]
MIPNIDPKKMKAVMKQMGISQEEILASKVIIEKEEGGRIIIENPSVTKITMQGQESFQIAGEATESEGISKKDIETIMEKTGCSEKGAENALKETGDLAEAILLLSK